MPRTAYEDWNPGQAALSVVEMADAICADYKAQGYDLTLRQLYYQFVARALIENSQRSYKRLGDIVNKARLAGLLDWDYIVDRTRNLRSVAHWDEPAEIISACAKQFRIDKWATQPTRVEVWVEKEALAGVIGQVADRLDVPWFCCRGYVSQSELWAAGERVLDYLHTGQRVVVLHLGDHDPSGIDMTRDVKDRLLLFSDAYEDLEVRRIALNMDQVQEYNPPPNPAKLTDSRCGGYMARHGSKSWELDALDPSTLTALIEDHVLALRDETEWAAAVEEEDSHRAALALASGHWDDVTSFLDGTVG